MGPIRGLKRRRKEVDQNAAALGTLPYRPQAFDWWDDFSKRVIDGPSSQLKDQPNFETVLKISRKTFNYICSLVKEEMMAKPSNFTDLNGRLLSLNDRVAVALRRLSSGESLSAVGDLLGINQSTVAQITWRFVEAMEERGLHHLQWPSTDVVKKEIKCKFERVRGLPNCCGAIDTTHIMMCLSSVDGSNNIWLDEEKNYSMIIQAIVDPQMRFLDIVTGWPGSLSDSLVLKSSSFFRLSEEGKRLNGKKIKLSDETELREYIVGDVGFPLLPWLLTPYQGHKLSDSQVKFNKKLSSTQKRAQRALAKLKEKWRIIQGVMWRPDKKKLPRIILVCCLLHNIAIDLEDEVQDGMPLSHHHDEGYRQQVCESSDKTAFCLRDKLSLHLQDTSDTYTTSSPPAPWIPELKYRGRAVTTKDTISTSSPSMAHALGKALLLPADMNLCHARTDEEASLFVLKSSIQSIQQMYDVAARLKECARENTMLLKENQSLLQEQNNVQVGALPDKKAAEEAKANAKAARKALAAMKTKLKAYKDAHDKDLVVAKQGGYDHCCDQLIEEYAKQVEEAFNEGYQMGWLNALTTYKVPDDCPLLNSSNIVWPTPTPAPSTDIARTFIPEAAAIDAGPSDGTEAGTQHTDI